jgi:hypothetical protein
MLKTILISFRVKATALLGHPQPRRCPPSLATGTSAPLAGPNSLALFDARRRRTLHTKSRKPELLLRSPLSQRTTGVVIASRATRGEGPQGSDGADGEEDPREEQRQEDSTHGSWYTKIVCRVVDAVTVKERVSSVVVVFDFPPRRLFL